MKTYDVSPGETIDEAIGALVLMARNSNEPVEMMFNGVRLEAHQRSDRWELERQFDAAMAARAAKQAGLDRRARTTIERVLSGANGMVTDRDRQDALVWIRCGAS